MTSLKQANKQLSNSQTLKRSELAKQALQLLLKISHTIRMYKRINRHESAVIELNNINHYINISQCMFAPGIDESIKCFKNSLHEINESLGCVFRGLIQKTK